MTEQTNLKKVNFFKFESKNLLFQNDTLKGYLEVSSKSSPEWGQLKNLIAIFQFLNYYWTNTSHLKAHLVYVGASPGSHLYLVSKAWEHITFHLYDPESLDDRVLKCSNVVYHQKNFDQTDIEYWKEHSKVHKDLFMVFDNRSPKYNKNLSTEEKDQLLIEELNFQYKCISEIMPFKSLLRVKFPSKFTPDIEKSEDEKHYSFFDGVALRSAFVDKNCQEFSLIPYDGVSLRLWNLELMNQAFFNHNNFTRQVYYATDFSLQDKRFLCKEIGLRTDFDGLLFYLTVQDYLNKFLPFSAKSDKVTFKQVISVIARILETILPDGRNRLLPKKS